EPVEDAEARLAYVAVTRARHRLDLGGLSWIRDHPDGTEPGATKSGHAGSDGGPSAAGPALENKKVSVR
ncbi:hypothetical protein ACFWEZ_38140, partial [Streptomyces sp. NPDC060131]